MRLVPDQPALALLVPSLAQRLSRLAVVQLPEAIDHDCENTGDPPLSLVARKIEAVRNLLALLG